MPLITSVLELTIFFCRFKNSIHTEKPLKRLFAMVYPISAFIDKPRYFVMKRFTISTQRFFLLLLLLKFQRNFAISCLYVYSKQFQSAFQLQLLRTGPWECNQINVTVSIFSLSDTPFRIIRIARGGGSE